MLTACQSPKAPPPPASSAALSTRNNCCSLLYQLLEEEKDVSLLRFIKREHSDVKDLIKRIAADSGKTAKLLEELARQDPSIRLDDIQLPPGETAARDLISSSKEKDLLSHSGDEFELRLLLTQTEALNYGWHLAKVAGENEPNPERARVLAGVSEDLKSFYQQVFALIEAKTK